jgi:hypothetical protein
VHRAGGPSRAAEEYARLLPLVAVGTRPGAPVRAGAVHAQLDLYGRWWHDRRAVGLRGVAAPPSRRCSLCGDVGMVRYLVPPSRWKRPEDEDARLCSSCYVAFYGPDDHWPLPEDEWPR